MSTNPYLPPQNNWGAAGIPVLPPALPTFPLYSRIFFILSLVFSVLRLLLVALSFVGWAAMEGQDAPLERTVIFEILTGAGMAVFGLVGNIMMLCRKVVGTVFGWLLVAFALGSLGVGVWQGSIIFSQFEPGSPQFIGGIIGMGGVLVVRLGLIVAYSFAIIWFRQAMVGTAAPNAASVTTY